MRRRPLLVGIAFVLGAVLVVAACGSDAGVKAGAPRSTTTTGAPPDSAVSSPPQDPNVSVPSGRAQRVEPTGNAVDVHPLSFDPREAKAVAGGVLVRFWGGVAPCFVLDRYTVEEQTDTVTVGLFAGRARANEKIACIELALRYEVLVPLDAPLDARRLVSAT
jgi:hypothetical protein